MNASARHPPPSVPVTVLTGFLGAGKTSLLNDLARDGALAETVVLINEFGEIGLDHLFVERIDGDMMMLAAGCLCCTIRGDLVSALENLLRRLDNGRIAPFRRLIIETTGLADPAPVLQTLLGHPYLAMRFRIDGVVAVVDAVNGEATLARHVEAVRQVAVADAIVIAKSDLADAQTDAVVAHLSAINPGARRLDRAKGEAIAEKLFDLGPFDPAAKHPDVAGWLAAEAHSQEHAHHHEHDHAHDPNRHDAAIRAHCLVRDEPISPQALDLFLTLMRDAHGPKMLRMKGIVALADDAARPLVIQAVQHVLHPPRRLDAWPDSDHRTRIVLILDGLAPAFAEGLFAAVCGDVAPDRPDRAALADNPLAPARAGLLQ
jgi:G3E family GTPase